MLRKVVLLVLLNGILLGCSVVADNENSTTPATPTTEATTTISSTTEVPTTTPTSGTTTLRTTTTKATTTVAPKPTTPAPPKVWPQNIGNWSVVSDKNITCILMRAALQVSYLKDNTTKPVTLDVPNNAEPSGKCDELLQTLTLTWNTEKAEGPNTLNFNFVLNKDKNDNKSDVTLNKFALENITGFVYLLAKVNETVPEKVEVNIGSLDTYQTSMNKSFKCESEEILKNKDAKGVELKVAHAQVEAFRETSDAKFGPAVECELDGAVADIVPIAVGASLAALVVVVLIAYLVGRRRSRARGYQSV